MGIIAAGCGARKPVAKVNGEPISATALNDALIERAGKPILDSLVDEMLIDQEAKRRHVTVSDKEIKEKLDELKAQFPSAEGYEQWRKQRGASEEFINGQLRHGILMKKLATLDVKITDEQIKQYYDSHKAVYTNPKRLQLRDILLDSESSAQEVHKALVGGGDFAALARQLSRDPATKTQGGDMGLIDERAIAPALRQAAANLQAGQFSGPIKGDDGWYLIQVVKREAAQLQPLDKVKDTIRKELLDQQTAMNSSQLLTELRAKAKIEILDPRLGEDQSGKAKAPAK